MKKKVILSIFVVVLLIVGIGLNFNYEFNHDVDDESIAYTFNSTFRSDSMKIASMLDVYFDTTANEFKEGIYYFTLNGYYGEMLSKLIIGEEYNLYDGKSDVFANQLLEYETIETGFYYVIGNKECFNNQTSFVHVKKISDNKYDYKFCLTTKENRYVYDDYNDITANKFKVNEVNINNNKNIINLDKFKSPYFIRDMIIIGGIISILICILDIIGNWMIFIKAHKPGWASLVPFYNNFVLFEIIFGNGWLFIIWSIALCIPIVGIIASILIFSKLGKCFGKSKGFIVGLIFLHPVFKLILAFDKSQYLGNTPKINMYGDLSNVPAQNNSQINNVVLPNGTTNYENQTNNINNVIQNGYNEEDNNYFYCSKCGTKLLKTTTFCPRCGTKFKYIVDNTK